MFCRKIFISSIINCSPHISIWRYYIVDSTTIFEYHFFLYHITIVWPKYLF